MTEATRDQIIPLISPITTGPLGVMHLPRLWYKLLLHSYGLLAEGYRHGHGGLDGKLLTALGIDAEAFIAFVEGERPDYQACERWVQQHATNLNPASIAAHNEAVINEKMPEKNAAQRREQFNIADPSFASAVPLINLDDWAGVHAALKQLNAAVK